jgi:ribosome-associated protein
VLRVTDSVAIEDWELDERFVRASGPGGQNVNKVATAVELRFDTTRAGWLDDEARERLRVLAGSRMTADDVILIDARRHRTQAGNREDARRRLADLVRRALTKPKRRRKTKPGAAAHERRVQAKKRRSETKRGRGRVPGDD